MTNIDLKQFIEEKYEDKEWIPIISDYDTWNEFKHQLNRGIIRSAEYVDGAWQTNVWVKKGILLGFRMGKLLILQRGHSPSMINIPFH